MKHGTDKVTVHHYGFIYDKYLPTFRDKKVKMLEIGLGCDMPDGPGHSYYSWLEYFPNIELWVMDINEGCVNEWAHKSPHATVVAGDQADVNFLNRFLAQAGTGFDVIVDDGGHTMNQQMTSLQILWKAVRPGGIYFIEDLETSFLPQTGGDPQAAAEGKLTTLRYVFELIVDKVKDENNHAEITPTLRSVDCDRQICAMIKKDLGTV